MLREIAAGMSFLVPSCLLMLAAAVASPPAPPPVEKPPGPPPGPVPGRGPEPAGAGPQPPKGGRKAAADRAEEVAAPAVTAHRFEIPLVEYHRGVGRSLRMLILVLVAGLHGVLIAAIAFSQYWSIESLGEPPVQVSFFTALPPPPPPPPPPPKPAPVVQAKPDVKPPIVQPVVIPDVAPAAAGDQGGVAGVEGGIEGGVPGGVLGGLPGGVVGGVPGGVPGPEPPQEQILRVGGDAEKPVLIRSVQPRYPDIARMARISGVVIIEAVIDQQGDVINARVIKPMPMGLSEAALEAVKQWKYKPATLNGKPVRVYFTLTVNFRLV